LILGSETPLFDSAIGATTGGATTGGATTGAGAPGTAETAACSFFSGTSPAAAETVFSSDELLIQLTFNF
jgi:hypothetical protein